MMKKIVVTICSLLVLLGVVAGYQYSHFHDGKLHVIFCDVGQGDAILIVTPTNKHILNDGGPDQKVLDCLSRHMPFWERRIDLMLLTHPHADHFFGMFSVLQNYHVRSFATEAVDSKTQSWHELLKLLQDKHISTQRVSADDGWKVGEVALSILAPTETYIHDTVPTGIIGEGNENASLETLVSYGTFHVLLTGDSPVEELEVTAHSLLVPLDVLQSPHHGSKTSMNEETITALNPKIVAISVGADNKYGHPSQEVISLYNAHNVPYYRTDQKGDIEFVSDGKTWKVQ